MLISGPIAQAQTPSCQDVISKCEKAIETRKEEVRLCNLGLAQSQEALAQTDAMLKAAETKLQSPTRNPFVLVTFGVVVGILITGYVLGR